MSPSDVPLHCAYCDSVTRYLGSEGTSSTDGSPLVRLHYLCPRCCRVWVMGPPGQSEAYDTGHPTPPDGLPTVNSTDET
jgi:hypothetical protein